MPHYFYKMDEALSWCSEEETRAVLSLMTYIMISDHNAGRIQIIRTF